jgi:hypothetical protein
VWYHRGPPSTNTIRRVRGGVETRRLRAAETIAGEADQVVRDHRELHDLLESAAGEERAGHLPEQPAMLRAMKLSLTK